MLNSRVETTSTWELGKLLSYDKNSIAGNIANPFFRAEKPEVHLWIFRCHADSRQISQMGSLLSPAELERSNAFYFKRDPHRYVYVHAMLRLILSKYTGQSPEDIGFSAGPH